MSAAPVFRRTSESAHSMSVFMRIKLRLSAAAVCPLLPTVPIRIRSKEIVAVPSAFPSSCAKLPRRSTFC
jgi:hypothetical protein